MARVYNRKEAVVEYTTGIQKDVELSRNYHVQRYILSLEVNTTTTAGAVWKDDNLFRLISSLNLVANGSLNIKMIAGEKLVYNYILNNGVKPFTQVNKGASLSNQVQKQTVFIDLVIPNEKRPQDTILFTKNFSSLYLKVKWASEAALGTGITVNSARLSIDSEQLIGYSRASNERINYFKETQQVETIPGAINNHYIKLDPNQFYTGFLLATKDADGLLQDNLITNIRTT
ncbi:MAG: hypothetical protein LBP54_06070 [Campylobacteraceae bacterium]|jgi:hypothetical protein|nr:hypothetical protein [Campylobacteraceae bacterium]